MSVEQGADTVELVFDWEQRDFAAALRARTRLRKAGRLLRWLPLLLLVLFALNVEKAMTGGRTNYLVLVLCPVIAVLLVLAPWLQARRFHRYVSAHGTVRVVLGDAGLVLTNDNTSTTVNWRMQPRYSETDTLFVLHSADKHATGITVLPKRGAASPEDVQRLRNLLDRHLTRV